MNRNNYTLPTYQMTLNDYSTTTSEMTLTLTDASTLHVFPLSQFAVNTNFYYIFIDVYDYNDGKLQHLTLPVACTR